MVGSIHVTVKNPLGGLGNPEVSFDSLTEMLYMSCLNCGVVWASVPGGGKELLLLAS